RASERHRAIPACGTEEPAPDGAPQRLGRRFPYAVPDSAIPGTGAAVRTAAWAGHEWLGHQRPWQLRRTATTAWSGSTLLRRGWAGLPWAHAAAGGFAVRPV
ncbi:hypothetical protein LTR53_019769, partial [Teratosphaeriaceae sp. CCFEE 6253]